MNIRDLRAGLVVLLLAASAAASDMRTEMAVRDSLSRVHPRMRASWLREHGLDDSPYTTFHRPDSGSGIRIIGRWPWGPSWELCGRDSLLFLGSGSGVRILSISDSIHPRQLGQIVARSLVHQLALRDTLLFIACGSFGAQVYSIADPANPRELGSMDVVAGNLCVVDTFCYTLGSDSLRAFNVANPAQPVQTSVQGDHGADIVEADAHLYVAGGSGVGMNVYDISNPSTPTWVNSRGGAYLTLWARGTLLFCSGEQPSYFAVLDISDPLNIQQIGYISGYGGHALYADDSFAYLSCGYDHEGIFVIDVTNPANPQMRGSYNPEGTENYDPYVPTSLSYGYLASDYGGLMVIDLHNVNAPTEAWSGYKAASAVNASVDESLAYIADGSAGLHILDVAEPTLPVELGQYDSIGSADVRAALGCDSFAYISRSGSIQRQLFRVLDVSDPTQPTLVATESCFNTPEDMVLRDSFIYAAEANRFQIFNVARPREPVLVGSCAGDGVAVVVQDSFAYTAAGATRITNIARPDSPFVVTTISRGSYNICIDDTMLFCAPGPIIWYDLHNPVAPVPVDSIDLGHTVYGLVAVAGVVYANTANTLYAIDVTDAHRPRIFAQTSLPYTANRIVYAAPRLYLACWDAGVCIFDTVATGVAESPAGMRSYDRLEVTPSPTRGVLTVTPPIAGAGRVSVWDVTGCLVASAALKLQGTTAIDITGAPCGFYVVETRQNGVRHAVKVAKQ